MWWCCSTKPPTLWSDSPVSLTAKPCLPVAKHWNSEIESKGNSNRSSRKAQITRWRRKSVNNIKQIYIYNGETCVDMRASHYQFEHVQRAPNLSLSHVSFAKLGSHQSLGSQHSTALASPVANCLSQRGRRKMSDAVAYVGSVQDSLCIGTLLDQGQKCVRNCSQWLLQSRNYFLRVISTLTHDSDIVSDIPSGSIYIGYNIHI